MSLKNKVAIVTGARQGIGYGIAKALAKEGANVIIADIVQEDCDKVAGEIEKLGVSTLGIKCDISSKEDIDNLIAKTKEKFGQVDILVNNAGIYPFKPFAEMTEADFEKVMDINVKGNFLFTHSAVKEMKKGGRVINISSIASLIGFPTLSHYCASKGAVNGFTRALALELAPQGITVNAVAPGAIDTPGAASPDEVKQQTIAAIPLKRIGTPEDIANMVVFLASDKSSYITGQVIVVDGGWTVQ
jgi:NAD(P)-dependent dehydrogenase (short-subunit alcohol dehydrogenase family)